MSPDLRECFTFSDQVAGVARNAPYEGDGRRNAPYEPSMIRFCITAYATGVFSSRAIARKLEEDVAFRGEFRSTARVSFGVAIVERMFVEVVRVAARGGAWDAVGGWDEGARANASKRKAR